MNDDQIHWFSIVKSLLILLFLCAMVAMIMLRTLYRDTSKHNLLGPWGMYSGLQPTQICCAYMLEQVFSSLVMLLVTMIFAVLGFLSPSNRGGTVGSYTPTLGLYRFVCWVFYKMFKGTEWKKIFFVLNALFWGERSSGAVPFTTMFALVLLWFDVSVPLVFVGSYVGFKKPAIEDPWKTNKIPRQIPEQA